MAENFYGITDTGQIRDNNEDNFIAQNILGGKYIAGCVIDGVGGYEGGEIAAALARSSILNKLKKAKGDVIETMKKAFIDAEEKITEEKKDKAENLQMACVLTLALADINENKFYYAHVGDTRLYLFRDNSLVKVTHDHSFVGFLEESGRLSEDAAMQHPRRNEINKAIGFDVNKFSEPDYIETGESPFLPGDILLLCSDGLSDMLTTKTISDILSTAITIKEKCKALINAANEAGGRDNITVVIIHNNKEPLTLEATKPLPVKKNEQEPQSVIEPESKSNKLIHTKRKSALGLRFLLVTCFVLLAALAIVVYNDYFRNSNNSKLVDAYIPITRNEQVNKLSNSIRNTTSHIISLKNIYPDTLVAVINDSLQIVHDTLYIYGNGKILRSDASYNGAAFVFSSNCKYILIDSLTFENFNTAIIARNKVIYLNNVRFKNCGTAVSYAMQLPDNKPVSGKISDSSLLKIDSVKNIITVK